MTTELPRAQSYPLADEKRADALRRMQLVPGDREEVDAEVANVDRNLSDGLYTVRVQVKVGLCLLYTSPSPRD